MKILYILVILVIFLFIQATLVFNYNKKYETLKNIRVAVLIITVKNTNRFKNEIEQWKKYMDRYNNIDCYFIECENKEEFKTIKSKCNEGYIPGIYQKTILSMEKLNNNYDFYLRTNLSSFLILKNLLKKVRGLPRDRPFYSGVYCDKNSWNKSWVGGYGILINNITKKILVEKGKESKYFNNNKIPDDVLIGEVLSDNGIKCIVTPNFSVDWNYYENFRKNFKDINEKNPALLRLKNENIKKYNETCNLLHKYFNKK